MGNFIGSDNFHFTEWDHLKVLEDGVLWMPARAKPRVHSELYDLTNDPEENKTKL